MECLSDASFLGKFLVLPANVRLDWKVIVRYKHYSLLGIVVSDKGKSFITLTTGVNDIKLFLFVNIIPEKIIKTLFASKS